MKKDFSLQRAIKSSNFYQEIAQKYQEKARRFESRGEIERACNYYVKSLDQLRNAVTCRLAKTNSPEARHNIAMEIYDVQEAVAEYGMDVHFSRPNFRQKQKQAAMKEVSDAAKYLILGKEYSKTENPLFAESSEEAGANC